MFAQAPADPPEEENRPIDPAVAAVLELSPRTPAELLQATSTLVGLGATDEAKAMLAKLVAAKPNEETLADLVREFGSPMFMRLASVDALAPEAKQLADDALAASAKRVRDPQRLAQRIAQTNDASPGVRRAAIVDLKEAGPAAIQALFAAMADPARRDQLPGILNALAAMQPQSIDPLLAALASEKDELLVPAMQLAGDLELGSATIHLLAPALVANSQAVKTAARDALAQIAGGVPTHKQAVLVLRRRIEKYLQGMLPAEADYEGNASVWRWDDAKNEMTRQTIPADDARLMLAARLARDLAALESDDVAAARLSVATRLEDAKRQLGFDQPLPVDHPAMQAAAAAGVDEVSAVLDYALDHRLEGAAAAAAETLGEIATGAILRGADNRPVALVRAAHDSNRRVRWAATKAIMKLDPVMPFAGSSFVADAVGYFASGTSSPRAVVSGGNATKTLNIAALVERLGFEAEVATRGERVWQLAEASADVQFVLVDITIDNPPIREVVYRLRRSPRTGELPIGILADEATIERARLIARDDPLAMAFARPHTEEAIRFQVDQLLAAAGRSPMRDEERKANALLALDWVHQQAGREHSVFDVLQFEPVATRALYVNGMRQAAAAALAALDTADGQQALVDVASNRSVPIADRQAVLAALIQSVKANGLLLTTGSILEQYDRYNVAETADRPTQEVLATILDLIEAKQGNDE